MLSLYIYDTDCNCDELCIKDKNMQWQVNGENSIQLENFYDLLFMLPVGISPTINIQANIVLKLNFEVYMISKVKCKTVAL